MAELDMSAALAELETSGEPYVFAWTISPRGAVIRGGFTAERHFIGLRPMFWNMGVGGPWFATWEAGRAYVAERSSP